MMKYYFHEAAERELSSAIEYYEEEDSLHFIIQRMIKPVLESGFWIFLEFQIFL